MIKGFILFLQREGGAGLCCFALVCICVFAKLAQKSVHKVAWLLCHLLASTGTSIFAQLFSSQRWGGPLSRFFSISVGGTHVRTIRTGFFLTQA